jgi:hypothetical protein
MSVAELLYDAVRDGVYPAVADQHIADLRLALERPDPDAITSAKGGPHASAADLEACVFATLDRGGE